jgi:hypothetical protein
MIVHDCFLMAGDHLRMIPREKEGGGLSLDVEAYGLHAIVVREVAFTIGRFSGLASATDVAIFTRRNANPVPIATTSVSLAANARLGGLLNISGAQQCSPLTKHARGNARRNPCPAW